MNKCGRRDSLVYSNLEATASTEEAPRLEGSAFARLGLVKLHNKDYIRKSINKYYVQGKVFVGKLSLYNGEV